MKKLFLLILVIALLIVGIFICIYLKIEFYRDGYFYMMSYGKDWDSSEDNIDLAKLIEGKKQLLVIKNILGMIIIVI